MAWGHWPLVILQSSPATWYMARTYYLYFWTSPAVWYMAWEHRSLVTLQSSPAVWYMAWEHWSLVILQSSPATWYMAWEHRSLVILQSSPTIWYMAWGHISHTSNLVLLSGSWYRNILVTLPIQSHDLGHSTGNPPPPTSPSHPWPLSSQRL